MLKCVELHMKLMGKNTMGRLTQISKWYKYVNTRIFIYLVETFENLGHASQQHIANLGQRQHFHCR